MGKHKSGKDPASQESGRHKVRVLIHVFAGLRKRTGQSQIEVQLMAGATVENLFRHLAERYDAGFLDVCIRPVDEPSISVVILNGDTLRLPSDLQRELKTGDELHLIPPIAGG